MAKIIVRSADGQSRAVEVIPRASGIMESSFAILSGEMTRLAGKATQTGLNKDDAYKLSVYVKALRALEAERRLQSRESADLPGDYEELKKLAGQVLDRLQKEEEKRDAGKAEETD